MIRAPLNIAELRATALAMSSRPTISTVNAWRVGMSTTLVRPPSSAKHQDLPDLAPSPVTTRANRVNASVIWIAWVTISVCPLGQGVRDQAAEQAEDQDREELHCGDHARG